MIEIIPAIDLIDGKAVRLYKGDYSRKTEYSADPLDIAKNFEYHGLKRLHIVDLDGAKAEKIVNLHVLEKIAAQTKLDIQFGGGIKNDIQIKRAFEAGAQQIIAGSIAVKQPESFVAWVKEYGGERIILGADVKDRKIAISGWVETSNREIIDFLKEYLAASVEYVLCTDVSKDGALQGPSTEMYAEIMEKFPHIKLIASGGVTTVEQIRELQRLKIYGAIIGKAYYENKLKLSDLRAFL